MTNETTNQAPRTQYVYEYSRNFYGPFAASRARKFGRDLAHMIRDTFFHDGTLERIPVDHPTRRGKRLEYETSTTAGSAHVHINYGAIPLFSEIYVSVNTRKIENTLDTILRCQDFIPKRNNPTLIERSQDVAPTLAYDKKSEKPAA